MEGRVLVAYATKYGATAEIGEKIGQVLAQAGLETDVLTVARVGETARYQAVVLGSAAYVGWWRKESWYRSFIVVPASVFIALVGLYWTWERIFS